MTISLYVGDSLVELKNLEDNSVDSVVTDPPYGLSFMGKKWDYDVPSVAIWAEVLRVLKPGGYLLSFGGTRTYHRMVVNIEDAGFEIRDQIQWLYGSGFPKSLDVSKAMDKAAGIKEWKETTPNPAARPGNGADETTSTGWAKPQRPAKPVVETDLAKQWQGFGTALKPANEPICLARKPLEGTVASNVKKWGCGALNIDASRVGMQPAQTYTAPDITGDAFNSDVLERARTTISVPARGRWPANLILDEEAASMLDEQSGISKSVGGAFKNKKNLMQASLDDVTGNSVKGDPGFGDVGGASRFFYCAKASKRERNAGLEGMPEKPIDRYGECGQGNTPQQTPRTTRSEVNHHPTVKPIRLMEYLIRLITPPNGTVLDPFMGSGSTGVAAKELGFNFIGIDLNEEYVDIAERRIRNVGIKKSA